MGPTAIICGIVCLIIIRFVPSIEFALILMLYLFAITQFIFGCGILYSQYKEECEKINHKFRFGGDKIFDILVILTFQLFATQGLNSLDLIIRFIVGIIISSVASYCLFFKNV